MMMLYVAIRAALDYKSSMLTLFFCEKYEFVIDHLKKLFQHVVC